MTNIHIKYNQLTKPHHKKVAEIVEEFSYLIPTIMDVGCGVGNTLKEVKKLNPDAFLVGADIDEKCLSLTNNKVKLDKKILIKDIYKPFARERSCDIIILSHVLEHLIYPVEAIKNLMKMLRKGGHLILAVPNPVRPLGIIFSIFRLNYVNKGHVYSWDRLHWMNFLENIMGLEVVYYSQDNIELPIIRKLKIFDFIGESLSEVFPYLSFSHIAVIRKND